MSHSESWLNIAAKLYAGDLPGCSGKLPDQANSTWCHWMRANDFSGNQAWHWRPPGLHEYQIGEAGRDCLRGKWYLFLGDSQARTLFYTMRLLQGHSPWPMHSRGTADVWAAASAEPTLKGWSRDVEMGDCKGDLRVQTNELTWNLPTSANATCMRDVRHNGSQYSFIFLANVTKTWGALCDLVSSFRRNQRAPDALVVAHYNWPLIFGGAASYESEVDALLDLMLLHRAPPIGSMPLKCKGLPQALALPPPAATTQSLVWVGQTKIGPLPFHTAYKRLQGNSSWRHTQERAFEGFEQRMLSQAGSSTPPTKILRVDGWHMVDAAVVCNSNKDCLAAPDPRMRDHVHYRVAAYQGIVQNIFNQLCLREKELYVGRM